MNGLIVEVWNDDEGSLISTESLLVATLLVIGIVVGLSSLRSASTSKLAELSHSFSSLNISYSLPGLKGMFSNRGPHQGQSANLTGTGGTAVENKVRSMMPPGTPTVEPVMVSDDPQN